MTALYLKKQLQTNIPVLLTLKKRAGIYPAKDFKTKQPTGKNEYLYIFDKEGTELKHYANEREEETLTLFQPNERVQVTLQEIMKKTPEGEKRISFLAFNAPNDVSAGVAPLRQNVSQATQDRKQEEYQDEQKVKSIAISLQGLMQAHISAGKTNEDALALAVTARQMIIGKALEISDLSQ